MPKWKALILASRPPFLQVTIASVLAGILIALMHSGNINWLLALSTLAIACLLHLSVNLIHEYWDWKSGTDNINIHAFRPFTGGSGMIQLGFISPKEELLFGLSLLAIGIALGIYVILAVIEVFWHLIIIGAIAVFSIIFYTGSPIKLAHRGLGEFFIFLNFGPLMSLGPYIVLTKSFHIEVVYAGILLGLFTAGIIIINEFPDREADKIAGKWHLIVRLKPEKGASLFFFVMITPYILVLVGILLGILPYWAIITLIVLPKTLQVTRHCFMYYDSPKELFPANINTIKNHLLFSVMLLISYVISYFSSIAYVSIFEWLTISL